MTNQTDFKLLIDKYLEGRTSVAEEKRLFAYYEAFQKHKEWNTQLMGEEELVKARLLSKIKEQISREEKKQKFKNYKWIAVAASLVILLSVSVFTYLYTKTGEQTAAVSVIQPGGNRATLTLNDGSTIILDSVKNGELAIQSGITIIKLDDGQLVYDLSAGSDTNGEVGTNTITTPLGGQYQLKLPDGTHVWLNALSSLRFPVSFDGDNRTVELTGEGYFEVSKNAHKPFIVKAKGAEVKVLGTKFNIMAYNNENHIETTLLEGSVNVKGSLEDKNVILKPNEQARIGKDNSIQVLSVDAGATVAWKNGYFQFNRENIQTVMKQLARWYDIDVRYEGEIPNEEIVGKIRRSVTFSQVLKMLALSNVDFKVEGKKITIKN